MTTYVGLLRAVNLGAHNRVSMTELRQLLGTLGMQDVRTLLQSGNTVFRSSARSTSRLEQLLENEAAQHLGLATDFIVRTAQECRDVVAGNPFPEEAQRDPGHLLVMFLKTAAARARVVVLQEAITGRELIRAVGKQLYVVYPDGVGRSRLTNALIEKQLGARSTGRNWNTVLKLAALVAT